MSHASHKILRKQHLAQPIPQTVLASLDHKNILITTFLLAILIIPGQAFCDAPANTEMDKMATTVVDTIFAPWVRKTALAVGGGLGLFQSIGGGGWKPLVGWGGLGIFINYIPKVINFLSTLGT